MGVGFDFHGSDSFSHLKVHDFDEVAFSSCFLWPSTSLDFSFLARGESLFGGVYYFLRMRFLFEIKRIPFHRQTLSKRTSHLSFCYISVHPAFINRRRPKVEASNKKK
ncbi:hypothetical protein Pfo_030332 [Paulownia fortunei]|nr:hypothetical protein Pfo_030332 [Paulownia fortunei]